MSRTVSVGHGSAGRGPHRTRRARWPQRAYGGSPHRAAARSHAGSWFEIVCSGYEDIGTVQTNPREVMSPPRRVHADNDSITRRHTAGIRRSATMFSRTANLRTGQPFRDAHHGIFVTPTTVKPRSSASRIGHLGSPPTLSTPSVDDGRFRSLTSVSTMSAVSCTTSILEQRNTFTNRPCHFDDPSPIIRRHRSKQAVSQRRSLVHASFQWCRPRRASVTTYRHARGPAAALEFPRHDPRHRAGTSRIHLRYGEATGRKDVARQRIRRAVRASRRAPTCGSVPHCGANLVDIRRRKTRIPPVRRNRREFTSECAIC